jgi:putative transcriptional regulator
MTEFGQELIQGMTEVLAYVNGQTEGCVVHTVKKPDVKAIRRQLHMSQERFSDTYQIPLPTLKNWEQGRRMPDAPAVAYLSAITKIPREIGSALNS